MAETGVVAGGVPDEREGGLARRAIGFWGALAMSIAAMGPLLGALGVAPLIVSQAGFSAPFIFIICWIAMGTVAFTIGRFSGVLPGAASIYSYISHGLGEKVGFLSHVVVVRLLRPLRPAAARRFRDLHGAGVCRRFRHERRLVDLGAYRGGDRLRAVDRRNPTLDADRPRARTLRRRFPSSSSRLALSRALSATATSAWRRFHRPTHRTTSRGSPLRSRSACSSSSASSSRSSSEKR